ncbi:MAG: prepilin peptidase, partial [Nanoarchaeota archaeon]
MIITNENIFLIVLGIIWIIGAVLQDLKRREVDNLWNFSLIAFALCYRVGVSVFLGDYWFTLNGVIGFVIFLILGNIFYYSKMFAGGDAKLMIALGAILPLSYSWLV